MDAEPVRLVLFGFGSVNQELCRILLDKEESLWNRLRRPIVVVGVSDSKGAIFNNDGFDILKLLQTKSKENRVTAIGDNALENHKFKTTFAMLKWIEANTKAGYDILVDGSPGVHMNDSDSSPNSKHDHGHGHYGDTQQLAPTVLPSMTLGGKISCVEYALLKGKSVVLANKSPLVYSWDKLHHLIKLSNNHHIFSNRTQNSKNSIISNNNKTNNNNWYNINKKKPCKMLYSATVCGGLPVVNVLTYDIIPSISNINKIEGIFNSTSNYILTQMYKYDDNGSNGMNTDNNNNNNNDNKVFDDALKEAQRRGIAETDPSLDIDGWDTAYKLYIILKILGFNDINIKDINVTGLTNDQNIIKNNTNLYNEIVNAKQNGMKIKLVATAVRKQQLSKSIENVATKTKENNVNDNNGKNCNDWEFCVRLEKIDVKKNEFLANCNDTDMAISIESDLFDTWSFKSNEYGVTPTSAAVLRDIIHICDEFDQASQMLQSKL